MSELIRCVKYCDAIAERAFHAPMTLRGAIDLGGGFFGNPIDNLRGPISSREKYNLYRNWVYSALHALASCGASQPINLSRLLGGVPRAPRRNSPAATKFFFMRTMPPLHRNKAAREEFEVIHSHPILDLLDNPNPMQDRWQFVYTCICNLGLTGWAFVVADILDDRPVLYALPTTWIKANKDFTEFRISNPNNPFDAENSPPLDRSQVAFARMPNPADPMAGLSPAASQISALRIDERIQTSQEQFFENGHWPGILVTIAKDPHPDLTGNTHRPILSGHQRRQIHAAVRRMIGGVKNYGAPAIVDGLIENIQRFTNTSNEMGWEKSEEKVKTRILSAFGVHPFILGEQMPGSFAQAYNVEKRFCERVNTFLSMISTMLNNFMVELFPSNERLMLWWEQCEAKDPSQENKLMIEAWQSGAIKQNEFRAWLGMPPDDDQNERNLDPKVIQPIAIMLEKISQGLVSPDQAQAVLENMGLPTEQAARIAGSGARQENPLQIVAELREMVQEVRKLCQN